MHREEPTEKARRGGKERWRKENLGKWEEELNLNVQGKKGRKKLLSLSIRDPAANSH